MFQTTNQESRNRYKKRQFNRWIAWELKWWNDTDKKDDPAPEKTIEDGNSHTSKTCDQDVANSLSSLKFTLRPSPGGVVWGKLEE